MQTKHSNRSVRQVTGHVSLGFKTDSFWVFKRYLDYEIDTEEGKNFRVA